MSIAEEFKNFDKDFSNLFRNCLLYKQIKSNYDANAVKKMIDSVAELYRKDYNNSLEDYKNNIIKKRKELCNARVITLESYKEYKRAYTDYKNTMLNINKMKELNPELSFENQKEQARILLDRKESGFNNAKIRYDNLKNEYEKITSNSQNGTDDILEKLKKKNMENEENLKLINHVFRLNKKSLISFEDVVNREIIDFKAKYNISSNTFVNRLEKATKQHWKIVESDGISIGCCYAIVNEDVFGKEKNTFSKDDINANKENGNIFLVTNYEKSKINSSSKENPDKHNWIEDYLLYKGVYTDEKKLNKMQNTSAKQRELVLRTVDSYLSLLSYTRYKP